MNSQNFNQKNYQTYDEQVVFRQNSYSQEDKQYVSYNRYVLMLQAKKRGQGGAWRQETARNVARRLQEDVATVAKGLEPKRGSIGTYKSLKEAETAMTAYASEEALVRIESYKTKQVKYHEYNTPLGSIVKLDGVPIGSTAQPVKPPKTNLSPFDIPHFSNILNILTATIFVLYLVVSYAYKANQDSAIISGLFPLNYEQLTLQQVGQEVLLQGVIHPNSISNDVSGMAAYVVSDRPTSALTKPDEPIVPVSQNIQLWLEVDNQFVFVQGNQYSVIGASQFSTQLSDDVVREYTGFKANDRVLLKATYLGMDSQSGQHYVLANMFSSLSKEETAKVFEKHTLLTLLAMLFLGTLAVSACSHLWDLLKKHYPNDDVLQPWTSGTISSVYAKHSAMGYDVIVNYEFEVEGSNYNGQLVHSVNDSFDDQDMFSQLNRYLDMQEQAVNLVVRYDPNKPKKSMTDIELLNFAV